MIIADLSIENFRGIRAGRIRFGTHTVLVGPNNAGKTTIIEALALLFGRDRLIRELTEHDFTGSSPQPTDRIRLIATVTGFPTDDPDEYLDWFRAGRGVPKYLDGTTGDVHPTRDHAIWKLCCQIGFQAYFDHHSLTVETVRYFYDHDGACDPFVDDAHVVVPTKLLQQVGFFLVRASRTWDGVLSFGSELFRRAVYAADGQPAAAVLAERDRLRLPTNPIEDDGRLRPLIDRINNELARFLPSSPQLKLRVTATDSHSLLGGVVAHFSSDSAPAVPAARQGSGLLSLQGLLLLLQLGRTRADNHEGFFMALEEPELHVPPPSQHQLVHRIQALSSQTIITTHAPAIAAAADPTAIIILRNENNQLIAERFLKTPLTDGAQNWVRKFFQAGRQNVITALMHGVILIPEGRSDHELLRAMARALEIRQTWDEAASHSFSLEIGLVPTEDAKVVETHDILARLHSRVCCLVDGDADGDRYITGLTKHLNPPTRILRWPDGWTLEQVAGWILMADEQSIIAKLDSLNTTPANCDEVVRLLEANKANIVLYETLAEAIAETSVCAERAQRLLTSMAAACAGEETPDFIPHTSGALVFVP